MSDSPARPRSKPGLSIRARLLLLVFAAALPLLMFSAVLLHHAYDASAALLEANAVGDVRRLVLAVEAQAGRAQATVAALADSPLLDQEDLTGFERAAARALVVNGLEGVIAVTGADGSRLAPNLNAPGQLLPLHRVFATGKPQFSGLMFGQMTHEPQVAIHVPVLRDGQVRFDAVLALPSRAIGATLESQGLPPGWFAVVADAEGRTIARTRNRPGEAGRPISPGLAALAASAEQGFGPVASREGAPVFAAFAHSGLTGWTVAVAVPAALVQGPRMWSIAVLAGGGLLLLASAGLAWLVGRGIARPVHALSEQAARLGRNELPDAGATAGVAETEAAGQALHQASLWLAARSRDREAALLRAEESEARLLLAQEAGQIGAWETDAATGRRTWSHQQFLLYGRDPTAPPHGDAWPSWVHPDDRARVADQVARSYAEPLSYQHEFRIIWPDGSTRWLRSAGRSIFRDGMPVRVIGITLDTTERHEAEAALREGAARLEQEVAARTQELAESEGRFRSYFEHSAEAMFVVRVEPDGTFVYETQNPAAEGLAGYTLDQMAGKRPEDVLPPQTAQALAAAYRQVVATGRPVRIQHTVELTGRMLDLDKVLVPVRDPASGRTTRIIGGIRDMTEQRRLEARLGHAQRLEAVGQLTGGVAHDFNNLLTVVIGNLSLLRRRVEGDERATRYLTSIEQAADRGARLTASLLAFSRRQALQVAPQDVGALLRESTTLLRRALGEEITLTLDVAPGLPMATADAAQLEAAVLNLAINARDAIMDAMADAPVRGGRLRISVRTASLDAAELAGNDEARPGRFVAIEVQDTGAGMTPEVRARAFEPFFTTKDVGQGTGLGLSQVFGFVRQLGGHVTLDSAPGHGTAATLFLPLAPQAAAPVEPPPLPITHPATNDAAMHATVLVVEDDDGIRDVTSELLRDAGFGVLTAPDAPSALAILRGAAPVDALFSDVVMPGGATGVDLAREARRLRPGLPVLLTSGYAGTLLTRYGADGEFELLAKPYARSALLARLSQMVGAAR